MTLSKLVDQTDWSRNMVDFQLIQ